MNSELGIDGFLKTKWLLLGAIELLRKYRWFKLGIDGFRAFEP
jgi:hypothetical protein